MPTPLRSSGRGEGGGPESPEALMISALLEDGNFDPSKYRVDVDDLDCMQPIWTWCIEHQDLTGRAPGLELISTHYPEFKLTPDVDPYWAAHMLRRASSNRRMREAMADAINLLGEDDVDGAYALMGDLAQPVGMRRAPVTLFDKSELEPEALGMRVPPPWDSLGRATGGHGMGEMWVVAARTGAGKTNIAASCYVANAIKTGYSCAYFSCEMPAQEIAQLVRRGMAWHDKELIKMLESPQKEHREHALDLLAKVTPKEGSLSAYDPSHGRITIELVRDALATHDYVVVDHASLLQTKDGRRAVDDWRVMSEISNRLKEETLRHRGRLLLLAQVNRAGESSNPMRTPKVTEIGGSDSLGQDADVIVMMQRFSDSAMLHEAAKVRRGPGLRFFSHYDPATPKYNELSRKQAEAQANVDENRRGENYE